MICTEDTSVDSGKKVHYKKIKLPDGTTRDQHRLIMEQTIGRKLSRYEVVHHKNGDRKDNRIENLEVMSLAEHGRMHRKGQIGRPMTEQEKAHLSTFHRGERNYSAKLKECDVLKIRELGSNGVGQRALGRMFGVDHSSIQSILKRKTWKHI